MVRKRAFEGRDGQVQLTGFGKDTAKVGPSLDVILLQLDRHVVALACAGQVSQAVQYVGQGKARLRMGPAGCQHAARYISAASASCPVSSSVCAASIMAAGPTSGAIGRSVAYCDNCRRGRQAGRIVVRCLGAGEVESLLAAGLDQPFACSYQQALPLNHQRRFGLVPIGVWEPAGQRGKLFLDLP